MNQKNSASDKQRKVSALSDSPQTNVKKPTSEIREGVALVDHSSHRAKPVMRKYYQMSSASALSDSPQTNVADHSSRRPTPAMRNYNPPRESKVKVVSSWESKKLFASQSTRRSVFGATIKKKLLMVSNVERKGKNVVGSGENNCVGVTVADHSSSHMPKEADQSRAVFKDAPVMRNFNPARGSKVKLVSSQEAEKLLASQRRRRHVPVQVQRNPLVVHAVIKKKRTYVDAPRQRSENARKATQHRVNAVEQEPAEQDQDHHVVAVRRPNGQERVIRNGGYDHTAREKVLEVLRLFKHHYKRLYREKEERRGTDLFQGRNRIDNKTLKLIENMGKRVNVEMRIGSVPGIRVGDRFQYKNQLRAVGLHSKPMCGIDYMEVGDMKLATSITASEGYGGYNDKFVSGALFYTGEGGNVISKEKKSEHQKLTKGNLALVNSMRNQRVVRVIRGDERCYRKGKIYTYVGLYLVEDFWSVIQDRKVVYKFKLCRIPGQPPLTCC